MEFKGFGDDDFLDIDTIQKEVKKVIEEYEPNVIVLDLRLLKADTNEENIENISGIKIL